MSILKQRQVCDGISFFTVCCSLRTLENDTVLFIVAENTRASELFRETTARDPTTSVALVITVCDDESSKFNTHVLTSKHQRERCLSIESPLVTHVTVVRDVLSVQQ